MALRSSWLVAAEVFVRGVLTELPLTEPVGVEVEVVAVSVSFPLLFADCLAAFSARRFCFEAEGAIVALREEGGEFGVRGGSRDSGVVRGSIGWWVLRGCGSLG